MFGPQARPHKKRCKRCAQKLGARKHYYLRLRGTEENRLKRNAQARKWRKRKWREDPEWRQRDMDRCKAKATARRIAQVAQLRSRQNGLCGICVRSLGSEDLHIDHIIPRALGGTNVLNNLQVTHSECNIRKGAALVPGGLGPVPC